MKKIPYRFILHVVALFAGFLLGAFVFPVSPAEAYSCYNVQLCGPNFGTLPGTLGGSAYHAPDYHRYRRYDFGNRYYYGGGWKEDLVRGGSDVVGKVLDGLFLGKVAGDQRDVAMAAIHTHGVLNARPGDAYVSSTWGNVKVGYSSGGSSIVGEGDERRYEEEEVFSLPAPRRERVQLDVEGLEKLLGEPSVLKAGEFVAIYETLDEYTDPTVRAHNKEVHYQNLKHLRELQKSGRLAEEWQEEAIASAMAYIREGILVR